MEYRKFGNPIIVCLDVGDEIMESLVDDTTCLHVFKFVD